MKKQSEITSFPKVTVVTVIYNLIKGGREQYFRQCLQSVHDQSYPNVEHIVIDGASCDGTLNLLEEYQKKGWIQYYSEPDKGIYDAMNKGAEKSTGKYIVFLNSDDFFHNRTSIEISIKQLEKDQADFSCGTARIVDAEKPVALVYPKVEFFMFFTPFCHQTVFMRKDVFFKEYGFNVGKYKIIADHDLITRMILKGYKLSIVDDILVSYRLGGFSNQLSNETMMLQKEYFSKLIEVNSNAREYKLNVNELKRLSSTVCDNVKKALSHLHYEKTKKKSIRVVIKRYFYPIIKIYKILRVPLFSIEKLNVPIYSLRKTYRFLSVKLFEKKMTPTEEQYRILYIPILTIKHLE